MKSSWKNDECNGVYWFNLTRCSYASVLNVSWDIRSSFTPSGHSLISFMPSMVRADGINSAVSHFVSSHHFIFNVSILWQHYNFSRLGTLLYLVIVCKITKNGLLPVIIRALIMLRLPGCSSQTCKHEFLIWHHLDLEGKYLYFYWVINFMNEEKPK